MSAPGRSRANGPTDAPPATRAPSRCEKAWIIAPSSIATPGPITTCGSIRTSRPIFVSYDRKTVSGATSVAPSSIALRRSRACIAASAAASWTRSLTPITSASSASSARVGKPARARRSRRGRSGNIRSARWRASPRRACASACAPAKAIGPALQSRALRSASVASLCSRIATSRPSRSISRP